MESIGMRGFAAIMSNSKRYENAIKVGKLAQRLVVKDGEITSKLGPLKGWNNYRVAPSLAKQSFRDQWGTMEEEIRHGLQEIDPLVSNRMEEIVRNREAGGKDHD